MSSASRSATPDVDRPRVRRRAGAVAIACIPLGLAAKSTRVIPEPLLGDTLGGALYVLLICAGTWILLPGLVRRRAVVVIGATALTCALEFLQLWNPPLLAEIRATLPGRLVLGTTFSATDFLGYALGLLLGAGLGRMLAAPRRSGPTPG